jgi:hypothetical protein
VVDREGGSAVGDRGSTGGLSNTLPINVSK